MSANREESAIGLAQTAEDAAGTIEVGTTAAIRDATPHPTSEVHAISSAVLCANCGAPVVSNFCGECGQRLEHAVHSVWHFVLEAAEDLTHADSRLWRTMLALLFKPGYLTAEFLAGRRMRYLPPLRLYLVLSVLFFLLAGVLDRHAGIWIVKLNGSDDVTLEPAPKAVAGPGETAQQVGEKMCAQVDFVGPGSSWLSPALHRACQKSVEDGGRGIQEVFTHNIPRAIFVALPILGLVMMPLYRRPRRYYIEHLLFFLHAHAFLFLLLGLFVIAATIFQVEVLVSALGVAVSVIIPYYYFIAMRRVYGQSRGRTFGKLVVLSLAYLLIGLFIVVATSVYSVLAQ
jgi:hypothetical protein